MGERRIQKRKKVRNGGTLRNGGLGMRLQMLSFTQVSNPGRKTGHMEGKELSFSYVEFEGPVRQSRKV